MRPRTQRPRDPKYPTPVGGKSLKRIILTCCLAATLPTTETVWKYHAAYPELTG